MLITLQNSLYDIVRIYMVPYGMTKILEVGGFSSRLNEKGRIVIRSYSLAGDTVIQQKR